MIIYQEIIAKDGDDARKRASLFAQFFRAIHGNNVTVFCTIKYASSDKEESK